MPVISRFYGIIIKMFFLDHNPPYFHAIYGEYSNSRFGEVQKLSLKGKRQETRGNKKMYLIILKTAI
ncbi:DUF4160 domain-containing protein [Geminocystis sp. CENA526]|uniref:DUF4160 domain-containing protein n=1 Tax=Geminocystis sp. CENA526 TaxID=1355871 RepID=UPI003D7019A3